MIALVLFVVSILIFNIGLFGLRVSRNRKRLPDPFKQSYKGIYVSYGMAYDKDTGEIVETKYVNNLYYNDLCKK